MYLSVVPGIVPGVVPATTISVGVSDAAFAYSPAAHTYALILELPPGEVVFAGHETHSLEVLATVTPEYVPAAQLVHTVVPNCPAGHDAACNRSRPDKFCEQFSAETDPASEDDPAGHCAHAPPFGP